jgi:hypothetical protein
MPPPLVRSWDRWRWRPMHPDGPNPIRAPVRAAPPSAPDRRTDRWTDRRPCQFRVLPPRLYDCPRCPVVAAAVLLYWRVEFSNVLMLTPTVDALTQCSSSVYLFFSCHTVLLPISFSPCVSQPSRPGASSRNDILRSRCKHSGDCRDRLPPRPPTPNPQKSLVR